MTALCQGQNGSYVCPSRRYCRLHLDYLKVPAVTRTQISSVTLWRQPGAEVCAKFEKPTPKEKPCDSPLPPLPAC